MHVRHEAFVRVEGRVRADDDGVLLRQDPDNIDLPVRGHAQAAALADGIVDDAAVRADDIAVQVQKRAGLGFLAGARGDDRRVVAVGDKADVLAVVLAGVAEAGFGGDLPRVGLAEGAEGEFDAGELLLRQVVEDVALVLGLVEGLFEDVLLPCPLDAGVVAGGDIAAAQDIGALKELVKFQIAVAVDAGVGGDAVLIGVDEAVDDAGGKFVLEVENVKREAQTAGNAPGVLRVVERAAGMALGDARVLVVIELHHAADAVVARVGQKLCRHAGIHAAGHGDEHLLSSHWQPETPAWRRSSVP